MGSSRHCLISRSSLLFACPYLSHPHWRGDASPFHLESHHRPVHSRSSHESLRASSPTAPRFENSTISLFIRGRKLHGTSFGTEHFLGYVVVTRQKVIFDENSGLFDENPRPSSSIGTSPTRVEYRLRDSNAKRCSVFLRKSRVTRKWNSASRLVFPTPSRKLVEKRQTHFRWH